MPFYSSPAARNAWDAEAVQKREKDRSRTALHAMQDGGQSYLDHKDDPDREVRPHDRFGRELDEDGKPIKADKGDNFSDTGPTADLDDDSDVGDAPSSGFVTANDADGNAVRTTRKSAFGDAIDVHGHGHGGVPRAQLGNPQHPQPADPQMLATPRSGGLGGSVASNPGTATLASLNYRDGASPVITYPASGLARPAPHPARPTGGTR